MRDADRAPSSGCARVNFYGLSEMSARAWRPSARPRDGLHVKEDHFLVEVIDPDSGEPVPEGEAASSCSRR